MKTVSPTINGIKYIIRNRSDVIEQHLMNGNQWNNDIIDIIKTYISQKNLQHFLNVGSHIGTVSLPISLCIQKVSAVEAYPPTYKHLCENILVNKIQNVDTYNIALGNSNEEIYFMSEDKTCPIEKINRVSNNKGGMHVFTSNDIDNNIRSSGLTDKKVKNVMDKLDNLQIDNFDIMLVDIEGCEYDFLLGAKDKITKNKPIIIIEIWNYDKRKYENMPTTQKEVIDYIVSLNYKLVKSIGDDFIFEPI
jgi:FkbM family methyltransferase